VSILYNLDWFAIHSFAVDGLDTSKIQSEYSGADLYYSILALFERRELVRIAWDEMVLKLK
jgi:hypothetical protein